MLARTRGLTRAAAAAEMSRESAYRLRKRDPGGRFAAAWDRALAGSPVRPRCNGHTNAKVASWREARKIAGFTGFSMKGHEVDEPLFSPPQTKEADLK